MKNDDVEFNGKVFYIKNLFSEFTTLFVTLLFIVGFVFVLIFYIWIIKIIFGISGLVALYFLIKELKEMPFVKFVVLKDDLLELYSYKQKKIRHYSLKNDLKRIEVKGNRSFMIVLGNSHFGEYGFWPSRFKESEILINDIKAILDEDIDEKFSKIKR